MRPIRIPRLPLAAVTAVAAVVLTACSGPAPSHPAQLRAVAPEPTYYLALGDSLARGVQPDAAGISVMTPHGYPDRVYAALHPGHQIGRAHV